VASLEAQHELAAGLPSGQVVGPIRGDDHQVRPRLLGDAIDQVGARRVDPVEVLDDEHGRTVGDGGGDEVEHGRGEVVAGERRVDQPGDGVEGTSHRARLGDGADRREPRRQRLDELPHEARLADARLPRDEGHGGLLRRHHLGGVDDPGEAGERSGPADHDRAHPHATAAHRVDARGHQRTGRGRIRGPAPRLPTAAAIGSPEAERSGDTLVVTAGGVLLPGRWEEDDGGRWSLGVRAHVAVATEEPADAGAAGAARLVDPTAGHLGDAELSDLDVHLGVHAAMVRD
jgi:hypothetical protein